MDVKPPTAKEIEAAIKRNTARLNRAEAAFKKTPNFKNDERICEARSDLNSWLSFKKPIPVPGHAHLFWVNGKMVLNTNCLQSEGN